MQGLITVLLIENEHSEKVIKDLHKQYPGVPIVIGITSKEHKDDRIGVISRHLSKSQSMKISNQRVHI